MGLRDQAFTDLKTIIRDDDAFGYPITVIEPGGTSHDLVGLSNEISAVIDPDTGQLVSGRVVTVSISIDDLPSYPSGSHR